MAKIPGAKAPGIFLFISDRLLLAFSRAMLHINGTSITFTAVLRPVGVSSTPSVKYNMGLLSRVEDQGRAMLLRLLLRFFRGQNPGDTADLPRRGRRILFIIEDALGDLVLTMSAIQAIAESHPDNEVDVVSWNLPAELLRHSPFVRRVIEFPRYDRRRLHAARVIARHGRYDAVVDGMVLRTHVRTRSIAMMLASRAPHWIGECGRRNDYVYNTRVGRPEASTPHLTRMLRLAQPFWPDEPLGERRPQLQVTEAEADAALASWRTASPVVRVLVNVSTGSPERVWPMDRYIDVVRYLERRGKRVEVRVVGLARDAAVLDEVTRATGIDAFAPSLRELMALIATADLVISPDTSVCHMASAFTKTLISLHNPGTQAWFPYQTPGARVVGTIPEDLRGVGVIPVLRAIHQVLADFERDRRFELPEQPARDFHG